MRIVVDAMGGDHPAEIVQGALAKERFPVAIYAGGERVAVTALIAGDVQRVAVHHAEQVTMVTSSQPGGQAQAPLL